MAVGLLERPCRSARGAWPPGRRCAAPCRRRRARRRAGRPRGARRPRGRSRVPAGTAFAGSASAAPPAPPQAASRTAIRSRQGRASRRSSGHPSRVGRGPADCNSGVQPHRLHAGTAVPPDWGPHPTHPRTRVFAGKNGHFDGPGSSFVGRMTTIVLQSGRKWGSFPSRQPVRGGGAPPTPPPRIDSTPSSRTT